MCLPPIALFHHGTPGIFFLLHFFSQYHFPRVHLENLQHIFYMSVEIPKKTMILLKLPNPTHLPFHHKNGLSICLALRFVAHTDVLFASLFYLKLAQLSLLCSFFFLLTQRFQIFLLSPKFQPLQIMYHFLTTTVYTFVPKYPQNELLGLSILLPARSTHQLFSP